MFGFLNVHKASGITAHDVVARVRKLTGVKQVGHGGTLDPMATGVLPIAVGKACRLLRFLPSDKVYLAEILLGCTTDTDDIEGKVIAESAVSVECKEVEIALEAFKGNIEQIPPNYSAVHHQGKRLYALARAGQLPDEIKSRAVTVYDIEILEMALPVVRVRIACAAGTYIRSIARDLGAKLGCGGCLKSLIREQAGAFNLSNSLTLEQLGNSIGQGGVPAVLIPPTEALGLPMVEVDPSLASDLILGRRIPCDRSFVEAGVEVAEPSQLPIAVTCSGSLVAICRIAPDNSLQPEVVIATESLSTNGK